MSDYKTCLPYVAAIIERQHQGRWQVLVQTRQNSHDRTYHGTLEFPAGTLDRPYENVFDTLKREIKEETGLDLKRIINDDRTEIFSPRGSDAIMGFRPFCCTQQLRDGKPWIGFVFRAEVESGEPADRPGETEAVSWMDFSSLHDLFLNSPEKIFGLELPALEYYFKEVTTD